ncbi:hypothetical protein JW758_02710 [Candidatus Peregrinibacteria bacterium]|nr:hypothetical protein [Candidatus Peregrinibacteria bacterium]
MNLAYVLVKDYEIYFYLFFIFIPPLIWLNGFLLPKNLFDFLRRVFNLSKIIYVVVAIDCDTTDQFNLINSRLIKRLKGDLGNYEKKGRFNFKVVKLNSYQCAGIDGKKKASETLDQINGEIIIWGDFATVHGKSMLELSLYVRHSRVPGPVSHVFSLQSSLIAPQKKVFDVNESLVHLSITAEELNATAVYMIGKALLLSAQPEMASDIHEKLLYTIETTNNHRLRIIKDVLKNDLYIEYVLLSENSCFLEYLESNKMEHLNKSIESINKAEKIRSTADVWSMKSILFYLKNDIRNAIAANNIAIKLSSSGAVLHWNEAFLLASNNDLFKSTKKYYECFRKHKIPDVQFQKIIKFIRHEIKNGHFHFNFILGIIYKDLGEKKSALKYLNDFISNVSFEKKYKWAYHRAAKEVKNINSKI